MPVTLPTARPRRTSRWLRALLLSAASLLQPALADHGIAQFGAPRYPAGFDHFDYVNPAAPKGGTLTLAGLGTSFDKLNPFTLKGITAPGVAELMFESLLASSSDEPASAYGLLAKDVRVAADGRSTTFVLNPAARFSDGSPVLASDVKYAFDTLMGPQASPLWRTVYQRVTRAVVVDPMTIRFEFAEPNAELPLLVGSLPIFSHNSCRQPDGTVLPFSQLSRTPLLGSGPYRVEAVDYGRSIRFVRNPSWWAQNLNVRRGMYNFDRIIYRMYRDDTAKIEAFKAGEFDAAIEARAKIWARSYDGPRFRDGTLRKQEFVHQNGAGTQGFVMNLRRPQFADRRVRQALALALDFEWLNRQLFFSQYRRVDSYFTNTELAANRAGVPSVAERALLEPWRSQLPPEVFAPVAPPASTTPPHSLRDNLRQARALLAAAGWVWRDGALRNARGQPLEIEVLDDGGYMTRVIAAYLRNLGKLGIVAKQRSVDVALYQTRLETFDFDMTTVSFPDAQTPGNELYNRFGSRAAHEPGSDNVIGVRSPAVDALIDAVVRARTRAELITASRALDRVLWAGAYIVPHWYSPAHRVAYRAALGFPTQLPRYYQAQDWILATWWRNDLKPR